MRITIIGVGNMGGAIAKGLVRKKLCKAADITLANPHIDKIKRLQAFDPDFIACNNNAEAIRLADIVILAVKPWLVKQVIKEIAPQFNCQTQILVSVAAGITFAQIESFFVVDGQKKKPTLFRVIPNTAIEVLSSMTFVASYNATKTQEEQLLAIFDNLGSAMLIKEEQMAAGTALASCGIAFAMRYIRAASVGGVELGFYPDQATEIVLKTVRGAVDLLLAHSTNPEQEIDKVTTPGGITIRGLNEMEIAGFTQAVVRGLLKCK